MPSPSSASMSSHYNSMQVFGTQISHKLATVSNYGKPSVDIILNNSHGTHGEYVTSYSTMDTIEGTVSIKADKDTRFEELEISFIGHSTAFVDRLTATPSVTGRTEATHRFLTLKQPIDEADLPCPRKLIAGKTYEFPFAFTVPQHLLPRACEHQVSNDHVRASHLMLPPSMGDPDLAGFGGSLLDDLAPDMARVTYSVKARLTHLREADNTISTLVSKMKKVRVKPVYEEQPPLNIHSSDSQYRLREEKKIKKGLFKGKLGTLVAECAQPRALVIPGARTVCEKPISTVAKLHLRFDPADEDATAAPPRLGSVTSKLKVQTYYASAPRRTFPSRDTIGFDLTQGVYVANVPLSTLCIGSAQWKKQSPSANPPSPANALDRRDSDDSGISDCSALSSTSSHNKVSDIPQPSKSYRGGSFYTATIIVPLTCPDNKNLLPTFHGCIISRVYALSLHISASNASALHLKVPIQVAAEGSDTGNANAMARSVEDASARDVDHMFVPRRVAPPSMQTTRTNSVATTDVGEDLPPQYGEFASGFGARAMVVA